MANKQHDIISVIMAAYNSSAYIEEAIRSVLAQDYEHWELLIVNDGSTDATLELAKSFDDPRIHVLSQENKGVSAARNLAFTKVTGDYICFLDADDVLPPASLSSRLAVFKTDPTIGYVDGKVIYADQNLAPTDQEYLPSFTGLPKNQLLQLSRKCLFGNTWMIKQQPNVTYHFDTDMTHAEDLFFYLSICTQSNARYSFTDQPVLFYRNNPKSAMTNLKGLGNGYALLIKKIKENGWATSGQLFLLKAKVSKIMFLSHLIDGRSLKNALKSLVRYFWL